MNRATKVQKGRIIRRLGRAVRRVRRDVRRVRAVVLNDAEEWGLLGRVCEAAEALGGVGGAAGMKKEGMQTTVLWVAD